MKIMAYEEADIGQVAPKQDKQMTAQKVMAVVVKQHEKRPPGAWDQRDCYWSVIFSAVNNISFQPHPLHVSKYG